MEVVQPIVAWYYEKVSLVESIGGEVIDKEGYGK